MAWWWPTGGCGIFCYYTDSPGPCPSLPLESVDRAPVHLAAVVGSSARLLAQEAMVWRWWRGLHMQAPGSLKPENSLPSSLWSGVSGHGFGFQSFFISVFCGSKEPGAREFPYFPKLCNILRKTFFLPHQPLSLEYARV